MRNKIGFLKRFQNWRLRREFEKAFPGQEYRQTPDGCIHTVKVIFG